MKTPLITLLIACFSLPSAGGNFTDLYPQSTIDKWRDPFREDIGIAFREDIYPALLQDGIYPALSDKQKRQLSRVRLMFPDRCPKVTVCTGDTEPFAFLAGPDGDGRPTIVMSIQSIRFWGDLALTYAWLAANGHTAEGPSLYTLMLRNQPRSNFHGNRYPLPIEALGIPERQARRDDATMKTFQDIFVSGVYFILAHELGHLVHRHPGNGDHVPRAVSRRNEQEADAFAASLLARIGQPPAGVVFLLTAWSSFNPNKLDPDYAQQVANMTHPIDSDRLRKLASAMSNYAKRYARRQENPALSERTIKEVAGQVRKLAAELDSPNYHSLRRKVGQNLMLQEALRDR